MWKAKILFITSEIEKGLQLYNSLYRKRISNLKRQLCPLEITFEKAGTLVTFLDVVFIHKAVK
jgi:hypothetical protein